MGKNIAKVEANVDPAQLEAHLESYQARALEWGAHRAKVIGVEEIVVDERVVMKCRVPRCFGYGTGAHCPPHAPRPEEIRELLRLYRRAVFFTVDVATEIIVRDKETIKERLNAYQGVFKLVNQLESAAFYDGHYLAVGFAAGSCRHSLCALEPSCVALAGQKCKHALRARPSMEAVGMDVFKMIAAAGWEVYPIGSDARPADAPKGVLAGLVVVA